MTSEIIFYEKFASSKCKQTKVYQNLIRNKCYRKNFANIPVIFFKWDVEELPFLIIFICIPVCDMSYVRRDIKDNLKWHRHK